MARRARSFTQGSKRHGQWSASVPQVGLVSLAGSRVLLSQVFVPFDGGETVIRTRGLFGYQTDQAAASEQYMGAIGIGIVSEQAATLGATAVPAPDTDSGWGGWLWHSYFVGSFRVADATGMQAQYINRIVIDSKAMRKVGDNERLVVVVQNSSVVGIQIYDSIRIYSKAF